MIMRTSFGTGPGATQRELVKQTLDLLSLPKQLRALVRQQGLQQHQAEEIRQQVSQCVQSVQDVARCVEQLYQRQECLENAGRQQAMLTEQHYENHVIEPLARQLFPIVDLTERALSVGAGGQCSCHDVLEATRSQTLELLAYYSIAPFLATLGCPLDAKIMYPAEMRPTADPSADRTIAANIRCGFRRGQRILRPLHVAIYRLEISLTRSADPNLKGTNL
jgi:molecular chaperone GrpE (heat shock protein)